MTVDSPELKELLLQSDDEYRQLAAKHHELEDRLNQLSAQNYLSEPEQIEEVTLKKRKLHLKDRMADIARRHMTDQ
jgi:uncharacterized protein YdcH (DUF465 family)